MKKIWVKKVYYQKTRSDIPISDKTFINKKRNKQQKNSFRFIYCTKNWRRKISGSYFSLHVEIIELIEKFMEWIQIYCWKVSVFPFSSNEIRFGSFSFYQQILSGILLGDFLVKLQVVRMAERSKAPDSSGNLPRNRSAEPSGPLWGRGFESPFWQTTIFLYIFYN